VSTLSDSLFLTLLQLQTALSAIADWMTSNLLCLNIYSTKTEFLLLVLPSQLNKIRSLVVTLSSGISVPSAASARNLGFIFDSQLTFSNQVSAVSRACFYRAMRAVLARYCYRKSYVRPSVLTLWYREHYRLDYWKLITRIISLGFSLLGATTSAI